MLIIRKIQASDSSSLCALRVTEEQIKYVGTIDEILKDAAELFHFHVVVDGSETVGFFNIDTKYSQTYESTKPNELGLRAFFIEARFQGRGYGQAASIALKPYLKSNYSEYDSIALTVNCKNPAAYNCYVSGGFSDSGELYHGGRAGPQHILRMQINS